MIPSAIKCYCSGRWTGKHRCADQMFRVMSHILPDKPFLELATAMVDWVPNLLNTQLPSVEVASLFATLNLTTVAKNPELVDTAILKEERNHLSMILSWNLTVFTQNLGIIKLWILNKKHKKPRMYRHSIFISEDPSNPIIKLVDCDFSEPAIGYANILKGHTVYLWRLAAKYSGCTINSYNDNVSRASPS